MDKENLQIFQNNEFGSVRTVMIDEKPYFSGTDVAKILGYSNPRDAVNKHCRWVAKRDVPHPQNPERKIKLVFIPEGDVYRLIIKSKLPTAEKFESWVMDEVLPSIQKKGYYIDEAHMRQEMREELIDDLLSGYKELTKSKAKLLSQERVQNLRNQVKVLTAQLEAKTRQIALLEGKCNAYEADKQKILAECWRKLMGE